MESSSISHQPDLSPTLHFSPKYEFYDEVTPTKRVFFEENEKETEITEMEIRIMNFLHDEGVKRCSPWEKMFDYYEQKSKKPKETMENTAGGSHLKGRDEAIKLNSNLYLKRSKTKKNN